MTDDPMTTSEAIHEISHVAEALERRPRHAAEQRALATRLREATAALTTETDD